MVDQLHVTFCEFVFYIFIFISFISIFFSERDEQNMDSYDHYWGISKPGRERWGITGTIYTDGKYDFWANVFDHNPRYNY